MKSDTLFRGPPQTIRAVILPLVILTSFACKPSPQSSQPQRQAPTRAHVDGTVHVMDAGTRTLEVITAVGHAVRIAQLQIAEDCTIQVPGEPPELASVARGMIVRVEYITPVAAGVRPVAVAIDAIPVDRTGGAR